MFRRVIIRVVAGIVLSSLCAFAQTASDTQNQNVSSPQAQNPASAPAPAANTTPAPAASSTPAKTTQPATKPSKKSSKKKSKQPLNPIADVDSKQPDKVLFDRAMDAMKHNKYDVARLSLQTLINTYPDSEYVARAKLAEPFTTPSMMPSSTTCHRMYFEMKSSGATNNAL